MDPKLLRQLVESESPELNPMLSELEETMNTIDNTLKPVLAKLKIVKLRKNSFFRTKGGRQYIEMKHNLLLSYSTFLVFYLMLKANGRDVKNHAVVFKLAHIKTLLEKLKPIDEKINIEINRVLNAEMKGNQSSEEDKDEESEGPVDDEPASDDGESMDYGMEDPELAGDDLTPA